MTTNLTTTTTGERLEALYSDLQAIAKRYGADSEDMLQEMCLYIVDKGSELIEKHDGNLIMRAKRHAEHRVIRARYTYTKYVGDEGDLPGSSLADEIEDSVVSLIPSTSPTPEEMVERNESALIIRDAAATLNPFQQEVVRLLSLGYTKVEIAGKLGVSKQLVNWHLTKHIQPALLGAER